LPRITSFVIRLTTSSAPRLGKQSKVSRRRWNCDSTPPADSSCLILCALRLHSCRACAKVHLNYPRPAHAIALYLEQLPKPTCGCPKSFPQ
jgi:hypothetical protein